LFWRNGSLLYVRCQHAHNQTFSPNDLTILSKFKSFKAEQSCRVSPLFNRRVSVNDLQGSSLNQRYNKRFLYDKGLNALEAGGRDNTRAQFMHNSSLVRFTWKLTMVFSSGFVVCRCRVYTAPKPRRTSSSPLWKPQSHMETVLKNRMLPMCGLCSGIPVSDSCPKSLTDFWGSFPQSLQAYGIIVPQNRPRPNLSASSIIHHSKYPPAPHSTLNKLSSWVPPHYKPGFETQGTLEVTFFWNAASWSLVEIGRRFRSAYCDEPWWWRQ
jgi:hypothetical protein